MKSGTKKYHIDGKWGGVPGDENINANGRKRGINSQASTSSYVDRGSGLRLSDLTMIYKDGQEGGQKTHGDGYSSSLESQPVCEGRDGMTEESKMGQTPSNGLTRISNDEHLRLRSERKDTDHSVIPDQSFEISTGHPRDSHAPGGEADPLEAVQGSLPDGEATEINGPREPVPRRGDKVLKLSPARMEELMSSPDWTPVGPVLSDPDRNLQVVDPDTSLRTLRPALDRIENDSRRSIHGMKTVRNSSAKQQGKREIHLDNPLEFAVSSEKTSISVPRHRDPIAPQADSPVRPRRNSVDDEPPIQTRGPSCSKHGRPSPGRIDIETRGTLVPLEISDPMFSPMPQSIPLPPFSLPTYLQLELSSSRPSPLYIHRSATADFPYESSRVKLERLQNFLLLPPALEQVLWFGALTCLDSWLYSFTILPLRFFKALYILLESWAINVGAEMRFVSGFVIKGIGRVWRRRRRGSATVNSNSEQRSSGSRNPSMSVQDGSLLSPGAKRRSESLPETGRRPRPTLSHKHRRQKSIPSSLLPEDKADILRGFLMISTCIILMRFDASRMYHWIRGQAAIKLYVIYNVLEVSDRLLSAIGQDVLECLFSQEALERKPDGRSKVFRPFWLFVLALIYTVIHAMSLFYQVITLNVAVNSYSNALITLLLSNQFVEIKSTVFKKFEKENLFQLTCADVVERFQLWLMLTIIASRNIVETGVFSSWGSLTTDFGGSASASTNSTPLSTPPRTFSSILPQSFTLFPSSLFDSLSGANSMLPTIGQVLGPFLVVLGSEMLVDWLKHAYINKFNNIRPAIYGRFLDVLAKDYYTNAFADQNLTRRLGLPVISLSCLFFRVSVQTYQMFLSAWLPQHPSPTPNTTSLSSIQRHYSPSPSPSSTPFTLETAIPWSVDRLTALFSSAVANAVPSPARSITVFTVIFILTGYVILLLFKLALGILLLSFARSRYRAMKDREREQSLGSANNNSASQPQNPSHTGSSSAASSGRGYVVEGGRRVGGWGVVEVGDEKNRWVYSDDPDGLRKLKEREQRDKNGKDSVFNFDSVRRYDMIAKRIW
ncbi:Eukaryotic membrane protein family domain containing protein [Elaphomyces granulatus]